MCDLLCFLRKGQTQSTVTRGVKHGSRRCGLVSSVSQSVRENWQGGCVISAKFTGIEMSTCRWCISQENWPGGDDYRFHGVQTFSSALSKTVKSAANPVWPYPLSPMLHRVELLELSSSFLWMQMSSSALMIKWRQSTKRNRTSTALELQDGRKPVSHDQYPATSRGSDVQHTAHGSKPAWELVQGFLRSTD